MPSTFEIRTGALTHETLADCVLPLMEMLLYGYYWRLIAEVQCRILLGFILLNLLFEGSEY